MRQPHIKYICTIGSKYNIKKNLKKCRPNMILQKNILDNWKKRPVTIYPPRGDTSPCSITSLKQMSSYTVLIIRFIWELIRGLTLSGRGFLGGAFWDGKEESLKGISPKFSFCDTSTIPAPFPRVPSVHVNLLAGNGFRWYLS